MSIDKSLRRKNSLQRARNVLTRGERIKTLQNDERWTEGRSPFDTQSARPSFGSQEGEEGQGRRDCRRRRGRTSSNGQEKGLVIALA